MGLFKSFRAVVLASVAGVTCALVGICHPSCQARMGATIVVADIAGYFLSVLINLVRRRAA